MLRLAVDQQASMFKELFRLKVGVATQQLSNLAMSPFVLVLWQTMASKIAPSWAKNKHQEIIGVRQEAELW